MFGYFTEDSRKVLTLSKKEKEDFINKSDYTNFGYRKLHRLIKREIDKKVIETMYQ